MGTGPGNATWRAAGRSFGSVAAGYAALRPGYPADAVAFLLGAGPRRVLDLGAGTGQLTDVLVAGGHDVLAVDPSPEMLAELSGRLPRVLAATGTAEALPVADGSVDAVVAGQAAHWFEPVPTARELRRVLRPGGVVGLIWNTRDERTPWVAALGELVAQQARDHREDYEVVVTGLSAELDADVAVAESAIVQRMTPEQVVGLIGTRSYVATMPPGLAEAFLGRIRDLLSTHPGTQGRGIVELPYVTCAYRLTPRR